MFQICVILELMKETYEFLQNEFQGKCIYERKYQIIVFFYLQWKITWMIFWKNEYFEMKFNLNISTNEK